MGTRSNIGMLNADNSVTAIYCHWDGYPEHNGKILLENYTDPDKLRGLLRLGGLSVLGPEIGVKHPFSPSEWPGCPKELKNEPYARDDEYRKRWGNMCRAYARDRGEKGPSTKPMKYANEHTYIHENLHSDIEYAYIFKEGAWYVWDYHKPEKGLQNLTRRMCTPKKPRQPKKAKKPATASSTR